MTGRNKANSRRASLQPSPPLRPGRRRDPNHRLSRVRDWEKLARRAKFHPATMAALCFVSLRQVERFFRQRFGRTPTAWTRQLRCRLAKELISKGYSSKAVVLDLHFTDHSHLCHEFKRVYGAPPQFFAPHFRDNP